MEFKYNDDVIKTLIKLIYLVDSKDSYLKHHSENVTKYVLLIGNELNLDKNDLEILRIGAMLHDIGKIGIPDYILTKNSKLSDNEFEIMKRHVLIGEALIPMEGFEEIKKMVRSHHERIDGKGYPDHLKGTQIPYFARILSVADTFDAMTTQRSYNKVNTSNEAFDELRRVSKKQINCENEDTIQQLDPYIVNAFIKSIKNNKILMEELKMKDEEIILKKKKK